MPEEIKRPETLAEINETSQQFREKSEFQNILSAIGIIIYQLRLYHNNLRLTCTSIEKKIFHRGFFWLTSCLR